jgi:fluoroquinolone transport system permease protein
MLWIQIRQDGMMTMVLIAPLLAGLFFRFGIPALESMLCAQFDAAYILSPYYPMMDLFLGAITSYMVAFVVVLAMLDEFDANLVQHFVITPLQRRGYLMSRLGLAMLVSWMGSICLMQCLSLTPWTIWRTAIVTLLLTLMSLLFALIVFSFSNNKVEGMAIAKFSGLLMLGLVIPFLVSESNRVWFYWLPSYSIAMFALQGNISWLLLASGVCGVWIWILSRKFMKKLSR